MPSQTAFEAALEFAVDFVAQRVPSELLATALRIALPRLADLADLDRWDAEARALVMARIDTALRAVYL